MIIALGAVLVLPALIEAAPAAAGTKWEVAKRTSGITIYNRQKEGSSVKELKATGTIKAPPWVCFNVVNDENRFSEFMPYTAESKVLRKRKDGKKVVYQRVDAPFISDRDYTMLISDESKAKPDGTIIYKKRWSSFNDGGPKVIDGVVRVKTNEGYWKFEPADGGKKTHATYYLFTDPGGALPAWVVNAANGRAVPGIFDAISEQAKSDRYRKSKPKVAASAPPKAAPAKAAPQTPPPGASPQADGTAPAKEEAAP